MADSPRPVLGTRFSLAEEIKKRWFLLSIMLVITLANVYPPLGAKNGNFVLNIYIIIMPIIINFFCYSRKFKTFCSFAGPLRPEYTVKYIAVSLIFFNSGLSLKTEVITVKIK